MDNNFVRHASIVVGMIFVLSWLACEVNAAPFEQWNRTFGGVAEDWANSVQQTSDGGYVIAGQLKSLSRDIRLPGNIDASIIKTDGNGSVQWERTFGNPFDDDKANYIQETRDRGYILAGSTSAIGYGAGSDIDAWLIKTDMNGSQMWKKTFPGEKDAIANAVKQTTDGGYVIAGKYSYGTDISSAFIIKTDDNGTQIWSKTFGEINEAKSVWQTMDGGYILAGFRRLSLDAWNTQTDASLIKVDINGDKQWSKEFGGKKDDIINSVQQTSDKGYVMAGNTRSSGEGGSDAWLIRINDKGDGQWRKTFGGTGDDSINSVLETRDEGFILAGSTDLYGTGKTDALFIKTDKNGTQQWSKILGGKDSDWVLSAQETSEEEFILAGVTYSYGNGSADSWLIKVSGESMPNQKAIPISSPTPIFTPEYTPRSTTANPQTAPPLATTIPAYTPKISGFDPIYAIAEMLAIAFILRRNKVRYK